MIISSKPAKINAPLVSEQGPAYVKPNPDGSPSSDIYNQSQLPAGFKSVKISNPAGFSAATNIPPSVVSKAQSLLKQKFSSNLPYNYAESISINDGINNKEYLALVTLHFDNHPRRNLQLDDGSTVDHPPYWHPGISIFERSDQSSKGKKKEDKSKSFPSNSPVGELAGNDPDDQILFSDDITVKASKNILRLKIAKLIENFEKNRQ